jgi:hypothetical protein
MAPVHSVHMPGHELLPAVLAGDGEALRRLFEERWQAWPRTYVHDEDGTTALFSDLEQAVAPDVAFDLIAMAIDILMESTDSPFRDGAAHLLGVLVVATGSTEVPAALRGQFPALLALAQRRSDAMQDLAAIRTWYRHAI